MAHTINKIYQETIGGQSAYVAVCTCGWKEKALTRKELIGRFDNHKQYPHKT